MRIALFLLALALTTCVFADEPTVSGVAHFWSQRLLPNGKLVYDQPVMWNDVVLKWANGFYLEPEVWLGLGTDRGLHSDGNEFDLSAGWKGNVGGLKLDAGVLYGDINPVGHSNSGDFVSPYLELGYPIRAGRHTFTPFVKGELAYVEHAAGRDGSQVRFGAADAWKMNKKLTLNQKLFILHTSHGVYGVTEGEILQWWIQVKKGCLNYMGKISIPLDVGPTDSRAKQVEVGVGFDW